MLVGRAAELERIEAVLADARSGRAGVLVLRGEPGIGKTALLEWAAERADGFSVLRAAGVESEAELAFAGLHQLLRPLLPLLDELPAPQAGALRVALALEHGPETEHFAVYLATLGLLEAAAEAGPLLCQVEDAHWLDAASMAAIAFAARRLDAEPVAILIAARAGERPVDLDRLPELHVLPLDEEASRALLAEPVCVTLAPARLQRLLDLAAGNPLALLELPHGLQDEAVLEDAAGHPVRLARTLEAAFARRIERLSSAARHAVLLAAAAGPADVGSLVGDPRVVAGLEEAEAAGLARAERGVVAFRHPLVRAAAYHAASASERRAAHAALASALPESAEDERAWHLAAATAVPDEVVARLLDGVAERAGRRGATAARARALSRAAALSEEPRRRCARLIDASRAAFAAGEAGVARRLLDDAAPLADDAILRADLAYARWDVEAETWASLYPSFLRAADEVAPRDPGRAARMFSAAGDYDFVAGRAEASRANILRASSLIGDALVPGLLGIATDVAWLHLADQRVAAATDLAVEILDVAERADRRDDDIELWQAVDLLIFAEDARARAAAERLVERMRSRSVPGFAGALVTRSSVELWEGHLRAAYARAADVLTLGELLGKFWTGLGATLLACVEGSLGDRDACAEHAEIVRRMAPENRLCAGMCHGALGLAAIPAGDLDTARRELEAALASAPAATHVDWPAPRWRPDLAEVLLRLGDVDAGLRLLEAFERDRAAFPGSMAAARRCRLLVVPADELDAAAASALEAIGGRWPFEEARTLLVHGERLRRAGRRVDARRQLERAFATFEAMGAEAWCEHVRRELRASGATLRRRDEDGLSALTPQERQIALAVAEGRTNREVGAALFISPKTVELHLSRVYRKLGIRSRADLARLHGADPATLASRD